MGIHERDYYDEPERPGFTVGGGPRMMVTKLVIVTVIIVVIDLFTPVTAYKPNPKPNAEPIVGSHWLGDVLSLEADVYRRPWMGYKLVTYGFAHAPLDQPGGIWHIALNMFLLWMFGRVIESRLGRKEFLLFYLVAIVFSGLVWLVAKNASLAVTGDLAAAHLYGVVGASGAVTAVFLSFVLLYPKQTVYIWGLFAVPAWLIGAIIIGQDLIRALMGREGNVAWQAHLGGAAFAFLYLKLRWNFSRLLPKEGKWKLRRGPKLRIHNPDSDRKLDAEADRVLEKVHREGEETLTARERRVLAKYSRRVRDRRQ